MTTPPLENEPPVPPMQPTPPAPQLEHDVEGPVILSPHESTLNTLSILFYIWGGLVMLGGCFFMIYLLLGLGLLVTPAFWVGGIFIVIGAFMVLLFFTQGIFVIYAGKCLARRERPTLITVMSCLICMSFPMGTALGVITIMTLSKPEVKALFEQNSVPQS